MNKVSKLIVLFTLINSCVIVFLWNEVIRYYRSEDRLQESITGNIKSNIFIYRYQEVDDFLAALDISGNFSLIRNASGDQIIFKECSGLKKEKRIIVASSNTIKILKQPAEVSFLNDSDEFIAWSDNLAEGITFRDQGKLIVKRFDRFGFDPSRTYFYLGAEIRKTNCIEKPIIKLECSPDTIFSKDCRIFVFSAEGIRVPYSIITGINCIVFKENNTSFITDSELIIPRATQAASPYYVEDMNPWADDEVLIRDVYDYKPDFHHLFNLKTQEFETIGRFDGWIFFLKEDILRNLERNMKIPGKVEIFNSYQN